MPAVPPRPTPEDLSAAAGKVLPDVIAPALDVVFCGINPGLYSAAAGYHFARPGNRFWPALHRSGFTPRLYSPAEQERLLELGLGITNLADRATASAAELGAAELREGAERLLGKVRRYRPRRVAFLGLGAYGIAFGRRGVVVGPAAPLDDGTGAWVLPNPSGLNAHYGLDALAAAFAELRGAVSAGSAGGRCAAW